MEDRWCAISIGNDEEWKLLCQEMGRADMVDDPRFNTFQSRQENEDEAEEIISAWTTGQMAEDVMLRLQGVGVAAGVVQNGKDLLTADPQMAFSGHYRKVQHAETGESTYDGPPFSLSKCPLEVRPGPLLGEHNDYVFQQLLGLNEDEVNHGYVEGIIV